LLRRSQPYFVALLVVLIATGLVARLFDLDYSAR
jgi:hypothetical protein